MADAVAKDARPMVSEALLKAGTRAAAGERGRRVTEGTRLTDVQRRVTEAALEQVNANKGREALTTLSADFKRGGWEEILTAQLLTDFDPDGNRRARPGSPEDGRLRRAREAMIAYSNYARFGYDEMPGAPAEKAARQALLREKVKAFVKSAQPFRDALMSPTYPYDVSQRALEEILRDDGLRGQIAHVLNEKLAATGVPPEAEVELLKAEAELEKEKKEKERLAAQKTDVESRLTASRSDRTEFETRRDYTIASIIGHAPAARQEAMGVLRISLASPTSPPDVRTLPENLDRKADLLRELDATTSTTGVDAAVLRTRRDQLNRELTDLDRRINPVLALVGPIGEQCREYSGLHLQRTNQERRIVSLSNEQKMVDEALIEKDKNVKIKGGEVDAKRLKRQAEAADFALAVEDALAHATKARLSNRTAAFVDEYQTTKEKAAAEAAKEFETAVTTYLQQRWVQNYRRWIIFGRDARLHRGQARRDLDLLFDAERGGPRALVEQVFMDARIPREQIALLMEDKNFVDSRQSEIIAKVIAVHLGTGGKFSKERLFAIANTDWGQETVQDMITQNESAQAFVQEVTGKGLTSTTVRDVFNAGRNKFLELLMRATGQLGKLTKRQKVLLAGGLAAAAAAGAALGGVPLPTPPPPLPSPGVI